MTDVKAELLPCPFCGDAGVHAEQLPDSERWGVHCPNGRCPTAGSFIVIELSERDVIEEWNKRPGTSGVALHPTTAALVDRFAGALKEKLAKAEAKYGYSDGWLSDDWHGDLVRDLAHHVQKGDPRDVAAYCAFAWHHGWSVQPEAEEPEWTTCPTCMDTAPKSAAITRAESQPALPEGVEAVAWASEWQGIGGPSRAFHYSEEDAIDNAKWMSGRAFPLYAAPPLHTGPRALGGVREAVMQAVILGGDAWEITDRVLASLGGVEQQEDLGSSAQEADTHRAPEGEVVADALTERLTKVAYATEFLDVREDILALIERDRKRWLDNIAVCELLAKARADLARLGGPDRPRR